MQKSLRDRFKASVTQVSTGLGGVVKTIMLTLCLANLYGLGQPIVVRAQAADTSGDAKVERAETAPEYHKLSNDEL